MIIKNDLNNFYEVSGNKKAPNTNPGLLNGITNIMNLFQ
jgi:hypothetical protein